MISPFFIHHVPYNIKQKILQHFLKREELKIGKLIPGKIFFFICPLFFKIKNS